MFSYAQKMFCNRDYVCNRRFTIDKDNKVIIIVNESVNHPKFPENPSLYRVKEYWSHMVIKPQIDFTKVSVVLLQYYCFLSLFFFSFFLLYKDFLNLNRNKITQFTLLNDQTKKPLDSIRFFEKQ